MTQEFRTEAALCLWEAMLEERRVPPASHWQLAMAEHWGAVGTAAMRLTAARLGRSVIAVWDELPEDWQDEMEPFDSGFVPALLPCIDWSSGTLDLACALEHVRKLRADA